MSFTFTTPGDPLPFDDVIDVRSPAEFAEDHIPGAINLPALSDDERATIGTIYVQDSRFRARRLGAAMVARNVANYLEGPLADRPKDWRPLVYCWRGGQRSGSVASILRQIGWQAETLEGGYKSYRRCVQGALYDGVLANTVVLIDGLTGSGKTALLAHLASVGLQTIDLEALAGHRGSLFGGRADGQPSQKAFESALAAEIGGLAPDKPLVLEAESSKIGDRIVPPVLWDAMCAAKRVEVTAPRDARAAYTCAAYADIAADPARLHATLAALVPYHGKEKIAAWQALAADGALRQLVGELLAEHYDPRYEKSAARRGGRSVGKVEIAALDDAGFNDAARSIATLIAGQ